MRNDTDQFIQNWFKHIVVQLADPSITRKKALSIIRTIHALYAKILNTLMQHQIAANVVDSESLRTLEILRDSKMIPSEYKIVQRLIEINAWVEIFPYILDSTYMEDHRPEQHLALKKVLHVMHVVNLTDLFTKLFGLDNFLNEMFSFIDNLSDDGIWIHNIMQSTYWKERKSKVQLNDGEIALPLFIYNDDFEPLNALGSHRGAYKLSGVYVYLPCLPPSVQSKLEYIFLGMLFYAYDRSVYGNTRIFMPFIDQLNKLQTVGVPVKHSRCKTIKLIPLLLIGDNLGLNGMMGFVECFTANYFCRLCRSFRDDLLTLTTEKPDLLRNEENYAHQCNVNNVTVTGIKEISVWNKLINFHVTENRSVDIMHDLFEGACHIILTEILNNFIRVRKLFTLSDFNYRLRQHNFGPLGANKNIASITTDMIKNRQLQTSASEMLTLFCHFPYIVGDLVEPDLPEWQIYLMLREIISIVLEKVIHKDTHILLKTLITEHHELFQTIFKKRLSPKLHFMIHYPRIMKSIGPLCYVSSMRFESFHRIFKIIIKNINCRKNITQSCAFKIKMRCASLFLNFKSLKGNHIKSAKKKKIPSQDVLKDFICSLPLSKFVFGTKNVEIGSVTYAIGNVIQDKLEKDGIPTFVLIKNIFLNDNNIVLLGCQSLTNLGFDNHFHAYKVDFENFFFIKSVKIKKLNTKVSYIFNGPDNKNFVMWD